VSEVWNLESGNHDDRDMADDIAIAVAMNEAEIMDKFMIHDALEIIWLIQSKNEVQPIVWPMRLHKHNNDCGRA
jgi:hypothetical protein